MLNKNKNHQIITKVSFILFSLSGKFCVNKEVFLRLENENMKIFEPISDWKLKLMKPVDRRADKEVSNEFDNVRKNNGYKISKKEVEPNNSRFFFYPGDPRLKGR